MNNRIKNPLIIDSFLLFLTFGIINDGTAKFIKTSKNIVGIIIPIVVIKKENTKVKFTASGFMQIRQIKLEKSISASKIKNIIIFLGLFMKKTSFFKIPSLVFIVSDKFFKYQNKIKIFA